MPGKLFWSVTVYDARDRSQVDTGQGKAVLSSLHDFPDAGDAEALDLFFGSTAPAGQDQRWIKTIPGVGWFVYFRVYGPQSGAFDGSWKPGDFEPMT